MHDRFAFYEMVRVRADVTGQVSEYAGREGYVGGMTDPDKEEGYSVYFPDLERAATFGPQDLESLGYRLTYEQVWGYPEPD